jgi:hypothetical protein
MQVKLTLHYSYIHTSHARTGAVPAWHSDSEVNSRYKEPVSSTSIRLPTQLLERMDSDSDAYHKLVRDARMAANEATGAEAATGATGATGDMRQVYGWKFAQVFMCLCMLVCRYAVICMHVYMYVCMCVCMYVCVCVCMYVCMCVCMYVCMYACVIA